MCIRDSHYPLHATAASADMASMSLFDACKEGRSDIVQAWLDRGADANSPTDAQGRTPLYVACRNGHIDAARLLLDRGAEVDRAQKDGWTPMLVACCYDHIEVVKLLLDRGAEVDRAREDGATPLYMACLLYTSPSPRDRTRSRMPSSA